MNNHFCPNPPIINRTFIYEGEVEDDNEAIIAQNNQRTRQNIKMENENLNPSISISETPQKRRGNNFVKIAAALIILGVTGAGASLASRAWDPVWNPFRPAPAAVLTKMAKQTKEIKTYHNKTTFDVSVKNKNEFKIKGGFEGNNDKTDLNNLKTSTTFNISVAMEGMQFSLAGETVAVPETAYLKLTTIPALPMLEPFFAIMGIDLQKLKNQWIKVDKESAQEMFTGSLPPELKEKFKEEPEKQSERQKELERKIETLIANKNFFIVKSELPDEKINGIKAYHYVVALNNEEVKKIIPELLKIFGEEGGAMSLPLDMEGELKEKIDGFLNKAGEIKADAWVGKRDLYLYKIRFEKEIDASKLDPKEEGTVEIKFTSEISNINRPVEISAPKESKTLKEIFTPRVGVFGGQLQSAQAKARDARRRGDISTIGVALEFYYQENNKKYPQSTTLPMTALKKYLANTSLANNPNDPGNGPCPGHYKWINNVGNPNKFCVYSCLETGKYVAAFPLFSPGISNTRELSSPPTALSCGAK